MESFGKAILSVGVALLKLDVALKSLNPFLAIAGGIALIAAAGVAKSMASKGVTAICRRRYRFRAYIRSCGRISRSIYQP
jgi:cobalamin biosynthesis protein CbiD